MAQLTAQIKSYQEARDFIGARETRTLGHNTRVQCSKARDNGEPEAIQVILHETAIVTYWKEWTDPLHLIPTQEAIELNSGGWMTLTTKERINQLIPDYFRLWQQDKIWYLGKGYDPVNSFIFQDHVTLLPGGGQVVNAMPAEVFNHTKKLHKQVNKYVRDFMEALVSGQVPAPGAGDCFYCAMKTEKGETLGDATNNNDHLEAHLEENYFVPALLYNAVTAPGAPVSRIAMAGLGEIWQGKKPEGFYLGILKEQAGKSLKKYLCHRLGLSS